MSYRYNYATYYQDDLGTYHIFSGKVGDDNINTTKLVTSREKNLDRRYKHELPGKYYSLTHDSLKQYWHDLLKWNDELMELVYINVETKAGSGVWKNVPFEYLKCSSHRQAVLKLLDDKCPDDVFPVISAEEAEILEGCSKHSMLYVEQNTYVENAVSYDFSHFFPRLMGLKLGNGVNPNPLLIPTCKGKITTVDSLPVIRPTTSRKVRGTFEGACDIYRCLIICKQKKNLQKFTKMFMPQRENKTIVPGWYPYESINHARDLQENEKIPIKIELIQDDKPNALVYGSNIIPAHEFFNYKLPPGEGATREQQQQLFSWFNKLQAAKNRCPKNRLIKSLFSGANGQIMSWGYKSRSTPATDPIIVIKSKERTTKCWRNMRFKPYLYAVARRVMSKMIASHWEELVYARVDGFILNAEVIPEKDIQKFEGNRMLRREEENCGEIYIGKSGKDILHGDEIPQQLRTDIDIDWSKSDIESDNEDDNSDSNSDDDVEDVQTVVIKHPVKPQISFKLPAIKPQISFKLPVVKMTAVKPPEMTADHFLALHSQLHAQYAQLRLQLIRSYKSLSAEAKDEVDTVISNTLF